MQDCCCVHSFFISSSIVVYRSSTALFCICFIFTFIAFAECGYSTNLKTKETRKWWNTNLREFLEEQAGLGQRPEVFWGNYDWSSSSRSQNTSTSANANQPSTGGGEGGGIGEHIYDIRRRIYYNLWKLLGLNKSPLPARKIFKTSVYISTSCIICPCKLAWY